MPRTRADQLHVSYSQVNTYLSCPEKFRQQYVKGMAPSHRSSELAFGSAIHGALAKYHSHLQTEREALPLAVISDEFRLLMERAEQDPTPILWDDDGAQADLQALGEHLLGLYLQEARVHRVLAVEVPFAVPLDANLRVEETLVGIIDLVEAAPDGSIYVTELKTSSRRYDQSRLRYDCQMSLYASAAATLGYPQPKLRFRVLLKTKQPALETYEVKRGPAQIAEAQRLVAQVTRAMDQGIFYPLRGWACAKCPFAYSCGE